MFERVQVTRNPPRALQDYRSITSCLYQGTFGYRFFGWFFLIGGIFLLAIAIALQAVPFAVLPLIACISLGFFLLRKAAVTRRNRLHCLVNGLAIEGRVIRQGRALNPFSSRFLYTLSVQSTTSGVESSVRHRSEKLWQAFPEGSVLIGMECEGKVLWGPEVGLIFECAR